MNSAPASTDDAMSGVAETVATETPVAEIYNLLLNLRFQFNPFNLPSIEEVILAIDNTFPEDPMKIVIPLRGAGQGLFKIILKKPVTDLSACKAEFTKITSGGTEVVSVPVSQDHDATPSSSFNSRKGTLVTFSQAAVGQTSYISNDTLDAEIAKHGELIKQTALQNHKGTKTLNGNKYCVIDPGDKEIPGTISVLNPMTQQKVPIQIRYKGQKWFCRRCEEDHIGPCEAAQRFNAAREARAREMINKKIVCDSTLRLADQVGLRADVVCMSGAGVGHLANVLRDDPALKTKPEVTILTSGVDVNNVYQNEGQYVYIVDQGIGKLKEEMAKTPDKNYTIAFFEDDKFEPALPPDKLCRSLYLAQELKGLQSEGIQVVGIPATQIAKDQTGHPDASGTKKILLELDHHYESSMLLNAEYFTNQRMYAGIQSVFRYGCRTCEVEGKFVRPLSICAACVEKMGKYKGQEKWEDFVRSLPPTPGLPPVIDPSNWRDAGDGGGGGHTDKRRREDEVGPSEDATKVRVTGDTQGTPYKTGHNIHGN